MWLRFAALIAILAAGTDHVVAATYLALGDSYTIGEGVAVGERWPNQLVERLREHGMPIDAAEIVAKTGWTTDELSAAMDAHTYKPPYALVTLLIGVNNQYRGRDLQNYRAEFEVLLKRAIALAGGESAHVVVVSIPDWGVTRFGRGSGRDIAKIATELDAYNAANAQIAKMLHCGYVDVTAVSRDGGDTPEMLTADGLHPSAAMYKKWTDRIFPAAVAALSQH